MPVQIETVLTLLPEILPGVQAIPLKRINPNPRNKGARPTFNILGRNKNNPTFLKPGLFVFTDSRPTAASHRNDRIS
jgi:hypothetical protein